MFPRISRYISIAVISLCLPLCLWGQKKDGKEKTQIDITQQKAPLFGGVALSVDVVGPVMKALNSDFTQMEVAARVNLKSKYFPIFELGYGESNCEGEETNNFYKVQAPYFRIGLDYNFTKKWYTGNRIFLGVRYGFSSFKYDIGTPGFSDPVWGTDIPFIFEDLSANCHWGEIVCGIETRIWKIFRLGWDVRYKLRISHSEQQQGNPWYIPGFGKYGNSSLGGTFKLIFDI